MIQLRRSSCIWLWGAFALSAIGAVDGAPASEEVVKKSVNATWYDASAEHVVADRNAMKPTDVSDRYASVRSATPRTSTNSTNWFSGNFFSQLADVFSFVFSFWFWILVVPLIFLVGLLAWYGYAVVGYARLSRRGGKTVRSHEEKATIVDLPFEIDQPLVGLLAHAERLRAEGDYAKAIIYLFSHVLIELDSASCIRLARGKTNRTYVRELRSRVHLQSYTKELVSVFESAFFGKYAVTAERFDSFWKRLPNFDQWIAQARAGVVDGPDRDISSPLPATQS